jgi:Pup-ligase protein.
LKDGRKISAIDVQRIYLRAASKLWRNPPDDEHAWILSEWENVLNDLERDPMSTRDRIDWSAKKFLLEALQQDEKLSWSDPWLQSIDLEYHNLDLDRGLYYELVRKGLMRRVTTEDEIKAAIFNPPETTRAFFRGRAWRVSTTRSRPFNGTKSSFQRRLLTPRRPARSRDGRSPRRAQSRRAQRQRFRGS